MRRKAVRILNDPDEAEDVLQDAFYRLWVKRYPVKNTAEAAALLGKTVRNESLNRSRRRRSERLDEDIGVSDDAQDEETLERENLLGTVEEIIEKELTPLQKLILQRKEYEGVTLEKIAKDLGMESAAARMQLSRARTKIREIYRKGHPDEYGDH